MNMALKPPMDIKPGRPIRVGTKMMRSGEREVSRPTVPEYAEELEQLSEQARQVAAGTLAPADAEASAPIPGAQTETQPVTSAFDHDGDGKEGGSPKGGTRKKG
jgi:hypothetical protein